MKEEIKKRYKVVSIINETPTVKTINFVVENGSSKYIPGQFINIYFKEFGDGEGKSYSISSTNENISITVRNIGKFSNRLSNLSIGNTVTGSLPYGYFYSEEAGKPIIMITGGIGVSPFRSMIYNYYKNDTKKEIKLFFSNKNAEEIIFKKEFDILSKKFSNFDIKYFITREIGSIKGVNYRRIELSDIPISNEYDYFICGSIQFVRDFWTMIKKAGIDDINIYTESFF